MSTYIPFTKDQLDQANKTDLAQFLMTQGEQLKKSGHDWRWLRHKEITVRDNRWYNHYENRGGYAINFVKEFYNRAFTDAIILLAGSNIMIDTIRTEKENQNNPARNNKFKLPKASTGISQIYAYLIKKRMIDREIIQHFIKAKTLYEDYNHHNAIFVGINVLGIPRFAQKKGTQGKTINFRTNVIGSDFKYSFSHFGKNNRLFVYESPIDMLSYITLHKDSWKQNSYLSLCSVSDIPLYHFLSWKIKIDTVILCLDNDSAGLIASKRISEKLEQKGYLVELDLPKEKDWNDQLCVSSKELKVK